MSAVEALARFIDMSSSDISTLTQHRVTLGMLERFTPRDLEMLGVKNAVDSVALVRAAPALGTLRTFMSRPALVARPPSNGNGSDVRGRGPELVGARPSSLHRRAPPSESSSNESRWSPIILRSPTDTDEFAEGRLIDDVRK